MAVDAAVSILTKIGGYMVAPIGHKFRYLTHYNKNVETLRMQIQNLGDKRDGVQRAIDAATRNGEEIKADVQRWLKNVEEIMAEAERLDERINTNKMQLNGWHSDLSLRYKLSKEARRISQIIMGLQGGVRVENAVPALPPSIEVMPASLPAPPSVELMSVSLPPPPPGIEFMSTQDFVAFESTKSTLHQIFEALTDENCNIVGLYGMGGVGKTTLVKEVGKKVKEQKLFDQVVMAVVSQNPDLKKIQGQIADMLGLKFSEESESGRAGRLYERLKNEKRILIILDDVWARIDLKTVGIPHGVEHEGCKIILTTRRESVCTIMGIQTKKIPVNVLPKEESWELFQRHVGIDIKSTPLIGAAMAVVGECKGLPIALATVGRALREKKLEEWNAAVKQLKNSKAAHIEGMDQDVFSCIRLSYDYLPSEETKLCFLFCCLFPEDYDIKIEYLARYGMRQGLIQDVETMVEARSEVHTLVENLKASCVLVNSEKEGCVKMHDLVRDVAISIASGGKHGLFLARAGAGLKEWPQKETFESYTGISLIMNDLQQLPEGLECPNMQILLLGENESFEPIPEAFFEGMKKLKVLDLSERIGVRSLWSDIGSSSSHSTPPRILLLPPSLKSLANLRTLNLDQCKLGNLSVLCMLKELEILSFFGSDIRELPEEIGELIKLRLLDLTFCQYLKRIPSNVISKLARLEELYIGCSFRNWEVEGTSEERSNASLSELKLLARLTVLCVEVNRVGCFPDNFLFPNLLQFEITVAFSNSINCYPNSRILYLGDIKTPLSDIFKTLLQMVEDLTLYCLKGGSSGAGPDNILPEIDEGGLNGLKSLDVRSCSGIESLINTNQWKPVILFANLEKLNLWLLDSMLAMCRGLLPNGSFNKLRVLKIEHCHSLWVVVPDNLVHMLKKLEKVTVDWCRNVQGSGSLVNLCNLTVVEIRHCMKLSYIFTPYLAQSLLHLDTLKIGRCEALTTIVAEDHASPSNNSIRPVGFSKLKVIEVEGCKSLTSVFTISIARGLVKLNEVSLVGNEQLLEIFCHRRNGEEEGDEKEILLPQLDKLQLKKLPSLERFCPESFNMNLPSLKELAVEECPMLNNFASDATTYGLKSAPNLVKVQVEEQTLYGAAIQNLFSKK